MGPASTKEILSVHNEVPHAEAVELQEVPPKRDPRWAERVQLQDACRLIGHQEFNHHRPPA